MADSAVYSCSLMPSITDGSSFVDVAESASRVEGCGLDSSFLLDMVDFPRKRPAAKKRVTAHISRKFIALFFLW